MESEICVIILLDLNHLMFLRRFFDLTNLDLVLIFFTAKNNGGCIIFYLKIYLLIYLHLFFSLNFLQTA